MPVSSPKEPCTLYKQLLKTEIKLIIPRLARWVIAAEWDLKQTDGANVVIWVDLAGYSHPCWKKPEFSLETSHHILRLDSNIFCSFWYHSNCPQEEWGSDVVAVGKFHQPELTCSHQPDADLTEMAAWTVWLCCQGNGCSANSLILPDIMSHSECCMVCHNCCISLNLQQGASDASTHSFFSDRWIMLS